MISLNERLTKAENRIKALKENEAARVAGKPAVHQLKGNASLKEMEAYRTFLQQLGGKDTTGKTARVTLNEMLTSTDIIDMIPKVISGEMIEAAEPELLAANLFTKIQAPGNGVTIVVPVVGEIYVREVGEGAPFEESTPDQTTLENNRLTIDIKKYGAKVSITEEAMSDYNQRRAADLLPEGFLAEPPHDREHLTEGPFPMDLTKCFYHVQALFPAENRAFPD